LSSNSLSLPSVERDFERLFDCLYRGSDLSSRWPPIFPASRIAKISCALARREGLHLHIEVGALGKESASEILAPSGAGGFAVPDPKKIADKIRDMQPQ
jgi:hypothetical protein